MKTVTLVLLMVIGITFNGFSQETNSKENQTLEQKNVLQLKKLTLVLNLSASQQKDLAPILAEQNKNRELKKLERQKSKDAKAKLTNDEKFNLKNKSLDEQIALKEKLSKILNDDQMKKWESMRQKKMAKKQKKHGNKKNKEILK